MRSESVRLAGERNNRETNGTNTLTQLDQGRDLVTSYAQR